MGSLVTRGGMLQRLLFMCHQYSLTKFSVLLRGNFFRTSDEMGGWEKTARLENYQRQSCLVFLCRQGVGTRRAVACYLHIYMWLGLLRHNGGCYFEGVAHPSFHGVREGDSRVGSNIGKGIGAVVRLGYIHWMVEGWEGSQLPMLQSVIASI